jgi:long-chain acyl-CoA synthetase
VPDSGPLFDALRTCAMRHPDKPALSYQGHTLSYGELYRAVNEMAQTIARESAGAWLVVDDTDELAFALRYLAATRDGRPVILGDGGTPTKSILTSLENGPPARSLPCDAPEVVFTSGSTGRPSAILLDGHQMFRKAESINAFIGNEAHDVEIITLPLRHSFGLGRLRCAVAKGQSIVLTGRLAAPHKVFDAVARYPRAGLGLVSSMVKIILARHHQALRKHQERIAYLEIGSEPFEAGYRTTLARTVEEARLALHYGMTEMSRATMTDIRVACGSETVGKPMPGVEVRLGALHGADASGGRSEILLRGTAMARGYVDESSLTLIPQGGWIHSRDHGRLDEAGYLHVEGRLAHVVKILGRSVAFEETEKEISAWLSGAGCVCLPCELIPGVPVLVAVVEEERATVDRDALYERLRQCLPSHQVPRRIIGVPRLPRLRNGKVDREAAAALVATTP